MPTILVTGSGGQLGRALYSRASQWPGWNFLFTGRQDLDITDPDSVQSFFDVHTIDYCINTAGYTAVDRAEREPHLAKLANANGPRYLAQACQAAQATLIQLSTDYVYHSRQNTPFQETDPVLPQSVYAQTKWEGEQAALHYCSRTMVIRASWVYAPFGHNFLLTMLRLGGERQALKVVYDQVGTPTYVFDLADAILQIIDQIHQQKVPESKWQGIFNYSAEGVASWYDFAVAIFRLTGNPIPVHPIRTQAYPTPAERPAFSLMSKEKIKSVFHLAIPHWQESLQTCIRNLLHEA